MVQKTNAMFAVGDRVRVKALDELRREFGEGIDTPCGFVDAMYMYCEQEFEVTGVCSRYDDENAYYYDLKGGDGWNFDECVLEDIPSPEPTLDLDSLSMHYNDLF